MKPRGTQRNGAPADKSMTGRARIERELAEPMRAIGWIPRARGWFTRNIRTGFVGVVAVATAVEGMNRGTALATLHVKFRDEEVESALRNLESRLPASFPSNLQRPDYKTATVSIPIGYLLPEQRFHEWPVSTETVASSALQMAEAVDKFGVPHLNALAGDSELLLRNVLRVAHGSWPHLARAYLLTERLHGTEAAAHYANENGPLPGDHTSIAAKQRARLVEILTSDR